MGRAACHARSPITSQSEFTLAFTGRSHLNCLVQLDCR